MPRVNTHYANLKVARDAPIEVIKAAYRSLSLKYHPDQHQGSEKAARIMRIINTSYEVLSDPVSRRQHDQWIATQETDAPPTPEPPEANSNTGTEPPPPAPPAPEVIQVKSGWSLKNGWQTWVSVTFVFIAILVRAISEDRPATVTTPQSTIPSAASPSEVFNPEQLTPVAPARPVYTRPQLAPNGEPWPQISAYLTGYDQFTMYNNVGPGQATVTVENQENGSDFLVKLFDRGLDPPTAVRRFLLRAHGKFVMRDLTIGNFDIRYEDLDTGVFRRSQPFDLRDDDKISHFSLTLYKVIEGNTHSDIIRREEFGQ